MASVKGCNFPDDLYYNVENNVWARREADGSVVFGMTAYAAALAGQIVSCTPKKVGRAIDLNKSAVTVESGKWVGPAKSAAAGTVAQVNEALVAKPALANEDPYGAGWLVILKPVDWAAAKATLTPGTASAAARQARSISVATAPASGPGVNRTSRTTSAVAGITFACGMPPRGLRTMVGVTVGGLR